MATEPALMPDTRSTTRPSVPTRSVGAQHRCPWCRSSAVLGVLDLDRGDVAPGRLSGRCADCRREVELVPARFIC